MKYSIKNEKDKEYVEIANKIAKDWMDKVEQTSKERNLNIQKDFRKILTIIKNEDDKNG